MTSCPSAGNIRIYRGRDTFTFLPEDKLEEFQKEYIVETSQLRYNQKVVKKVERPGKKKKRKK